MNQDLADARALFEKAERETNPEAKARALDEATSLLASLDPDDLPENERKLAANIRLAHTRRLLAQLVTLASISMDAWFEYIGVLFGELRPEVDRLIESDAELRENYQRFIRLWGSELAEILQNPRS